MGLRRMLFLRDTDLVDHGELRPLVLPALWDLQRAGWLLALDGGRGVWSPALAALVARQGITFPCVLGDRPEACRPQVAALRQWLGDAGVSLDLSGSVVVGEEADDRLFAANLGSEVLALGPGVDAWPELARQLIRRPRVASVRRTTSETKIFIQVNLDGQPAASVIHTGIGFFDHMLAQLARHGGLELQVQVEGDLHIDEHHTVEDTALALGEALRLALGDRYGIERYAFVLPMDEVRVTVALDLSGRPYLVWRADFPRTAVGGLPTELVVHFFRSLCETLGATLHVEASGDNTHHLIEGIFKAVARALKQAVQKTSDGVPSTKGVL